MSPDLVLQGVAGPSPLAAALVRGLNTGVPELIDVIDSYMAVAGKAGNASVLPVVTQFFSTPENLSRLIDLVIAQNFDECVAGSFNHHTGFDKLVMLSGKNFKLRLHNFHSAEVQRPSENVHNHRWSFASSIVSGYFVADMYVPDEAGETTRLHYTYSKSGMTEHGPARLAMFNKHCLTAGTTYYMPTDAFHSITEIAPQGAVTVMMTGFADGETTEVYADHVLEEREQGCVNKTLSDNEILDVLESIKAKVLVSTN